MSAYYIGLALFSGAMLSLQIGINSSLAKAIDSRIGSATLSFTIGAIALILFMVFTRASFPTIATIRSIPLWTLTGGVLGAIYVALTIYCAPVLGSTLLIVLVVTGQIALALVLDHYGLVGFPVREINMWRVLGAVMMVASVVLIVKN